MLFLTLAILAAEAASLNLAQPTVLGGVCQYSPEVVERSQDAELTQCDAATLSSAPGGAVFAFGLKSWPPAIRLRGTLDGNRLTITQIALRGGPFKAASGICELFYADGRLLRIGCLAKAGPRYYAANFLRRGSRERPCQTTNRGLFLKQNGGDRVPGG